VNSGLNRGLGAVRRVSGRRRPHGDHFRDGWNAQGRHGKRYERQWQAS
jgi:hypothetical protein